MNRYYDLCGKSFKGMHFAVKDKDFDELKFFKDIKGKTKIPFGYTLKDFDDNIIKKDPIWLDYLPSSKVWPFMSEKLMNIIDERLTGKEKIVWMSAKVKGPDEVKVYYVPRFEKKLDVIDEKKTTYTIKGSILNPAYSLTKIQNYSMFSPKGTFWQITIDLVVTEEIKKAIVKEKLTGISFEEVTGRVTK